MMLMSPGANQPTPDELRQLQALRQDIDGVDDEILTALVRRLSLARAIGEIKQRTGQPVLDPAREASVVTRAAARARDAGLPEQEMRALYWQLMALARRAQLRDFAGG
jgi:chorismate mutase